MTSSDDIRRRVFVSSVVEGFEEYRQAARAGIEAVGGIPVLVNEDFPSLSTSPRNACLDGIDSSDYVAAILGNRGGWMTSSGKLVIEEEFDYARSRSIPIRVFLQETSRDEDGTRFAKKLSDFVDGMFRTSFRNPDELQRSVSAAFQDRLYTTPMTREPERNLSSFFPESDRQHSSMTILRLVLSPVREEEVVSPMQIESQALQESIYRLGHDRAVGLFDYARPKSANVRNNELVIEQTESNGRHGEGEYVQLIVTESGTIVLDLNVTGRVKRGSRFDMLDSQIIAVEDMRTVSELAFRFLDLLYGQLDAFKRHEQFFYNVGLRGIGYKLIQEDPHPGSGIGMSMRSADQILAYDSSRRISRAALALPSDEINRTITVLRRKAAE